jgi:hypothetical protein
MVKAKCQRCFGSAEGITFEEASNKINHAIGLSRGVPCGSNFNKVVENKTETSVPERVTTNTDESNTKDNSIEEKSKKSKSKKTKKDNNIENTFN